MRYLGHVSDGIGVVHQFALVHFDFAQGVDGQQEFTLMSTHASGHHALHQFGMLVNQPRLPQDVGCRVF